MLNRQLDTRSLQPPPGRRDTRLHRYARVNRAHCRSPSSLSMLFPSKSATLAYTHARPSPIGYIGCHFGNSFTTHTPLFNLPALLSFFFGAFYDTDRLRPMVAPTFSLSFFMIVNCVRLARRAKRVFFYGALPGNAFTTATMLCVRRKSCDAAVSRIERLRARTQAPGSGTISRV